MERIVIVGTGQGGLQVAASLRDKGFDGTITLIGAESGLPYQRPPLSKAYLKTGDADALRLRPESWFKKNRVDLMTGTRVTAIDRSARAVDTDAGQRIAYDHLVLATGARNAPPPIPGLDHPGVFDLRDLSDAVALRDHVAGARRAVVIGGGFIGLEFAAVATGMGIEVCVLEMSDRLMSRVVSPEISARFLDAHTEMGTRIRLGTGAAAIDRAPDGLVVRTDAGETEPCAMVVVAAGVRPVDDLAVAAGLDVDNGIVVDGQLRTSDPDISALGDVAAFPGPHGTHVRLESVQAATDHARHIAARLTDPSEAAHYAAVPWFWSDQGDLKLQIAGLGTAEDTHIRHPASGPVESVFVIADDHLVAVETVNAPGVHMAARRLLARPDPIPRRALEDADFNLRDLARAAH